MIKIRVADGSNDRQGMCLEGFRTGSSDGYNRQTVGTIKVLCERRRSFITDMKLKT